MAHALIKTFDVGAGDCIFFVLNNGDRRFSIMTDCGKYDVSIGNYVANELDNHIDLLIVTHIDEDHVLGIQDMLSDLKDLTIGRIIFNCAQLTKVQPKNLPPSAKEAMEKLKNSKAKKGGRKKEISAPQSLLLSSLILASEELRVAWGKQEAYVTSASVPMDLGDGFGTLTFLSPDEKDISRLDRRFRKAFVDNFYMRYDGPYVEESSIYELLLCGISEPVSELKKISSTRLSVNQLRSIVSDDVTPRITNANKASLAFMWECNGSRVLFCGDADPQTIVYNFLRSNYLPQGQHAVFDAIKVPHHGSAHNCGSRFWDTFDSENIFITGSDKDWERPSKLCLAKIVARPCEKPRILRYTHSNKTIEWMQSDTTVADALKYTLTKDCEYGFEY